MAKLYNLARMSTSTIGTGTVTLGSAVSGCLSFADAGVQNGDVVSYGIVEGNNSEVGRGTYTTADTTLTRNVLASTNSGNAISLTGSAQVFITALSQDITVPAATTTDGHLAVWDGTNSKTLKDGGDVTIDANGVLALPYGTPPTSPVSGKVLLYSDYVPSGISTIPLMLTNTYPSGTASASESYSACPPYWAFNPTTNGWLDNGSALPQWLRYQFTSPICITDYSIRPWWADNYPSRAPKTWTFDGSNNGTDWTTLDTQTDYSFTNQSTYDMFSFSNTTSYAYYRVNITANNGNAYCGIGGLRMFQSTGSLGIYVMDSDGSKKFLG